MKVKIKRQLVFIFGLLIILTSLSIINEIFYSSITNTNRSVFDSENIIKTSNSHNPILINGNGAFTAENGVKNPGALGTISDPYIIEDWIIDGGGSGSCILIENTDKYFLIKNCTVYNSGSGTDDAGIRFENVDNGKIINSDSSSNNAKGIRLYLSNNNIISNNTVYHNSNYGIMLRSSNNNEIKGNELYNDRVGIHLHWSNFNTISKNEITKSRNHGFWFVGSDSNTIKDNTILESTSYGVLIAEDVTGHGDNNDIYNNSFISNNDGGIQSYDEGNNNDWDIGSLGNYWSDYEARYVPPAINDGVFWDTPYSIDGSASSQDNYPLVDNLKPSINFSISNFYLNTTTPFETDLSLEINCSVSDISIISWVYLSENSTGAFINRSMSLGINGEWTYSVNLLGLDWGDELMFSFYANDSYNNIGINNNNGNNFLILIGDFYSPIIAFEISDTYLSSTRPLETDLDLEINCSISDLSAIEWVYLSENSTGVFINRSMSLGNNGEWTYTVDISTLVDDDILMLSFSANDSYDNIGYLDNGGLNFSILICDYYRDPIYINGNDNFTLENGVRNPWASGTKEDPFIIENWIIDGGGSGSCILIENTSKYFKIENCTVYNSGISSLNAGIKLYNATNGMIINNHCFDNSQGIRVGNMGVDDTIGNIIIMGNDCSNNSNTGIVLVKYSNNTILRNNCSFNGVKGIQLAGGNNNTVSENKCFNNEWGIFLSDYTGVSSNNNTISGNNIFNNSQDGIRSTNCNDNIILGNNITNNTVNGIHILSSNNNIIVLNNVSYSGIYGIFLKESYNNSIRKNDAFYNTHNGLAFDGACNNLIYENNFTYNTYVGINLYHQSHNNTIFNNIFRENGWQGVYINEATPNNNNYNMIYMNKFIGNNNSQIQACDNGYNNQWDNGTIGNYWDDYEDKYPNAWNDGFFWDIPYAINGPANSFDNHPIDNFLEDDPQYSDIKAVPIVYSLNGNYQFNCTWTDNDNALSKVYLKFNATYYLVTENNSGEFSYTFYNLPANEIGYPYQWLAKDQYNAWNATPISYFVLQKANAPLSLLFNGTGGDCMKYSHQYVNISLINKNEVLGEILLYINGNIIEQSSSFSIINISRYSIIDIYNVTGILIHQNYTGRIIYWMTIDDIIAPDITFEISLSYLNTTTPQYYQTGLQINCTVQDDSSIIWVHLCENSTGVFVNRSMSYVNGNYTFNLDISSLNWSNTIMFSFYAKDSAGNIKWKNNGGLNYSIQIYDFQNPTTTLDFQMVENPNFINDFTLFSLLTEDNLGFGGSGVTLIGYNIDGVVWNVYTTPFNISGFDEGFHTIYYNATDYAGNIEITNQITVYLDITNVISSIDFIYYEDSGIKYVNNFTQFALVWNDGIGSGLKNLFYNIDSEPFSVYNTSFTLLGYSEGLHNITYNSIDNVGNVELEKSIMIYLDITALDLNIFYNVIYSSNYVDEDTNISITPIEDLGSGVKMIQYKIDGGTWMNGTEFDLNGLTFGEHTIYYRVEDNIGNFREKSEVVFLVTNQSDIDDDGLTYQEEQNYSTDPFNNDTDNDGMPDGWEVSNSLDSLINDSNGDLDSDNLSNLEEYTNNTDPNDSDTDNDGMPDGWEVSNSLDSLINDSNGDLDSDNLSNLNEFIYGTNPNDYDTDRDKLLDGDEINLYYTNPLSRDTDGDGYSDYDEIFEFRTNPNSALSSPTINIIFFIIIFSTITTSGFVGVKKWRYIHRRRVEDKVITLILEDENKVLDHNVLNERLLKVKSNLNFENISKKRGVNGQYILNGAFFVKDIGIEKFETLIKDIVKKNYDQNLSKREDGNLIKLNITDLEQDEKLFAFIKKLKGDGV